MDFFSLRNRQFEYSLQNTRVWHNICSQCESTVQFMCALSEENTQGRLFGFPSTGWFYWYGIFTVGMFFWGFHFGSFMVGGGQKQRDHSLFMLIYSWWGFFSLSPSFSWSIWSVLSCLSCVKTKQQKTNIIQSWEQHSDHQSLWTNQDWRQCLPVTRSLCFSSSVPDIWELFWN